MDILLVDLLPEDAAGDWVKVGQLDARGDLELCRRMRSRLALCREVACVCRSLDEQNLIDRARVLDCRARHE